MLIFHFFEHGQNKSCIWRLFIAWRKRDESVTKALRVIMKVICFSTCVTKKIIISPQNIVWRGCDESVTRRDEAFFECDDAYFSFICTWPKQILNLDTFRSVTKAWRKRDKSVTKAWRNIMKVIGLSTCVTTKYHIFQK